MRKSAAAGTAAPRTPAGEATDAPLPDSTRLAPAGTGDARLVELARQGDEAAFAALVARYERTLLRVLSRMVRDDDLARDLAQETFWKVYNRLDRFDTGRRFGPWLFQIGVRLCLDEMRRRTAAALPGPVVSIDQASEGSGQAFDLPDPDPRIRLDLVQEVHHVLDRLPLPYRTVLILRDLEGFSSAEVAAIIGKREATVRWRLSRARALFRAHWERRDGVAVGLPTWEADDEA